MKKLINRFLAHAVSDRRSPHKNRERVGQNLMLLTIFIFFVFIINFSVIIGTDRKFGKDLSKLAAAVHQQLSTVQAKRGTIYDRNGNVIAEDSTTYSVYAVISKEQISAEGNKLYVEPSQYDTLASILNQYLAIDIDYAKSLLKQEGLVQTSFGPNGSNISYATMKELTKVVEENGIQGVGFSPSPGRVYPNGIFASEFIGTTNLKENEDYSKSLVGSTGMEFYLNKLLSGTDGQVRYQKDRRGLILLGTATTVKEAVDGKDIYTTLSAPLQSHLEVQMDAFQEKVKGTVTSATVMNAKTGEILALTQRPTFEPNTKEGVQADNYVWDSQFYQSSFEPGSTMKVMTLASAIDNHTFKPDTVYFNDKLEIADATIKDWKINMGLSEGEYLTIAQGFAMSSNIAMAMLEKQMKDEIWLNYLIKYRFGLPTRFGMGAEEGGTLPEDNEVTMAMSSFGQGINVTQAQLMRAFTAVSNDGVMVEPQFISKIVDPNTGASRLSKTEVMGKPVSKEAASKTRDYMVTVGTDPYYGTLYSRSSGPIIKVDGYNVAVKSGTAQIAGKGGYLEGENNNLYSVMAMVPAEDPVFMMYVSVKQPEVKFDGMNWQDIFNPVLSEAMLLQDILVGPPYAPTDEEMSYELPNLIGQAPGPVADTLRQNLLHPIILGTGSEISKVSLKAGQNVPANKQVLLLTDDFTTLPDMYGWTKENIKTFASWTGIEITFKGKTKGKVIAQSVPVGTSLKKLRELTVTLE